MASGPGGVTNRVWPSGSAWAAKSAPIFPPAPVLFSTTTGWPHLAVSLSAAMRARTSLMPPPGNGTMNLTGRAGNPGGTCPCAGNAAIVKIVNKPSAVTPRRMQCSGTEASRIRLRRGGAIADGTGIGQGSPAAPWSRNGYATSAVPPELRAGYGEGRGCETEPRNPVPFRKLLFSCILSAAVLVPAWPVSAQAQTYPDHPVRIIVPIGPGGAYDIIGRLLANKLTEQIGQSFFVENRTGCGTLVGTQAASTAPADGYTLVVGGLSNIVFNFALYQKVPYE